MNITENDETINEILKEDYTEMKNSGKKKSCLARVLIFLILLALIFFGFVYVQQYLLDLEAEAIVRAAQTATALEKESSAENKSAPGASKTATVIPFEQVEPAETPTPDPLLRRTATIAAQLTSAAEFQETAAKTP